MTTQIYLSNKKIKLKNQDIIGVGGEASVFKYHDHAVKVYLTPSQARSDKLKAMQKVIQGLPTQVVAPVDLVYATAKQEQAIGFTMPLLDVHFREVRDLANKKKRASAKVNNRDVIQLFIHAHQTLQSLHGVGMIVGDLNDLNLMYCGAEIRYIDVDSFQFDQFPCMVATESFLDPSLYGVDLGSQPYFKPTHDWYAFAVLLFKSLLLTHPYGGVHPSIKLLTQRAQQQVSVFNPDVKYPKIAYHPDVVSDDLNQIFENWFSQGQRGVFPQKVLQDYLNTLMQCPHCDSAYPQNRPHCPHCSTVVPMPRIQDTSQAISRILIETDGQIVAWRVIGSKVYAIAYEGDKAIYYVSNHSRVLYRVVLFNAIPHAQYAFLGDYVVVSPSAETEKLMVIDPTNGEAKGILQTTTQVFGQKTVIFGTSHTSLYRLAGGYLLRGTLQNGELIETPIMAVAEGQTWFTVAPDQDCVFGFFRTFDHYQHWLLKGQQHRDAEVKPLEQGETLVDMTGLFSQDSILLIRYTLYQGIERIRFDEIDHKGRLLWSRVNNQTHDLSLNDAYAYTHGMILYATDDGILLERLDTGQQKHFSQTEAFVSKGDGLRNFNKGLVVLKERQVIYIEAT